MAAANEERDTRAMATNQAPTLPVAAGVKIYAGTMVAVDTATGNAHPATISATRRMVGIAVATVDNTGGAAGAQQVEYARGLFAGLANSGTVPVVAADRDKIIFVEDDQTLATSGGATPVPAGRFLGFTTEGALIIDTTVKA
jgi:hypothetical protein